MSQGFEADSPGFQSRHILLFAAGLFSAVLLHFVSGNRDPHNEKAPEFPPQYCALEAVGQPVAASVDSFPVRPLTMAVQIGVARKKGIEVLSALSGNGAQPGTFF